MQESQEGRRVTNTTIATTRTLRRILGVLENQKVPVGISKITTESTGSNYQIKKYKDGLLFLISIGIVEKIRGQNPTGIFYKKIKKAEE